MSGESVSTPTSTSSSSTTTGDPFFQGGAKFEDVIKSPMFKKYLTSIGAGMMGQPTFGRAINAGMAAGSQSLAQQIEKQQEQETELEKQRKQFEVIRQLLGQYSGDGSLGSLLGNLDINDIARSGTKVPTIKGD